MFTAGLAETIQDVVTLNGVEPGMISGLLDYAYTGQITITKHNVQSMLSAANLLEILPVRDACCQVMLVSHWPDVPYYPLVSSSWTRTWTSLTVSASTALRRSIPVQI